jgi:hypothetical protein
LMNRGHHENTTVSRLPDKLDPRKGYACLREEQGMNII